MNNKVLVGIVILVVLGLGVTFPRGNTVVDRVIERVERVGAVATLDGVDNPNVRINGVGVVYLSSPITATSSVFCAVQVAATATPMFPWTVGVNSNGLGAQNFFIATSTTPSGTTTPNAFAGALSIGAVPNLPIAIIGNSATTSLSALATSGVLGSDSNILPGVNPKGYSNYIIKPGEYIVAKIATSTAGTFSSYMSGSCSFPVQLTN